VKYYTEFFNLGDKVGLIVGTKDGVDYINAPQIALAVNESTGETEAKINADHIYLNGETSISALLSGTAQIEILDVADLYCDQLIIDQSMTADSADFDNGVSCGSLTVGAYSAAWKSFSYDSLTYGTYRYFLYSSGSSSTDPIGATGAYPITGHDSHTIYYLGHD
jgi:hypothetical protein